MHADRILPRDLRQGENSFSLSRFFLLRSTEIRDRRDARACMCMRERRRRRLRARSHKFLRVVCVCAPARMCICALSEGHVRLLWRMAFEKVNTCKRKTICYLQFFAGGPAAPTQFPPSCAHLADYLILYNNIIVRPVRKKKKGKERGEEGEGRGGRRSVCRTGEGKERKRERDGDEKERDTMRKRRRVKREREKTHRECSFDQKHNFRDVIGGRACANWFRWFSMHGETRATSRSTPLLFPHSALHIAKKRAALSRRGDGTGFHRYRARFARATAAADIYPSTPTC